jgi:hypothetical protein
MRASLTVTALLIASSVALPAAAEETAPIRYAFRTLLLPDVPAQRSLETFEHSDWFIGRAVPAHAVVLAERVATSDPAFDLTGGAILSVSRGEYFIACRDAVPRTCLIDMDRDGALDGWFHTKGRVLWSDHAERVKRDDIHPIAPVTVTEISPEALREIEAWGHFSVRYESGHLTLCIGGSFTCLTNTPRIKPSRIEQTVEFMGGLYSFRSFKDLGERKLAIQILRDPTEMVF